jgi:hypothetical protein
MSHIHFVGGEKGGVGKSVVARLLAQRFVDRSIPFAAVDGDQSSGALLRYYGEYTQPVDFAAVESADQIMDRALGSDRRVLVDLPAQSVRSLWKWLTDASVFEFCRETGIRLSFWHVTDGGFASTSELEKALRLFGSEVNHFVVKNHGRSKDFSQFDQSEARRLLDGFGGKILDLPELEASTMFAIDRFGSSFWAAIYRADGEAALKPLDRQRVRLWLARWNTALDAIEGSL